MTILSLLAAAALAPSTPAAPDPRSVDAVAAFEQVCVSQFTGGRSHLDPGRFSDKALPKGAYKLMPWQKPRTVVGRSGVVLLAENPPGGSCYVLVKDADEASLHAEFDRLALQTATKIGVAPPEPLPERIMKAELKPGEHASAWVIHSRVLPVFVVALVTHRDPGQFFRHSLALTYSR